MFQGIYYPICITREHYRYHFPCVVVNLQYLISRIDRLQNVSSRSSKAEGTASCCNNDFLILSHFQFRGACSCGYGTRFGSNRRSELVR